MKRFIIALSICAFLGAMLIYAENVKDGNDALDAVTTGDENVALGSYSLQSLTTGYGNTALGAYAGRSAPTVNGGIYLGYGAGRYNTTAHRLFIQTIFYPDYGIYGLLDSGRFGINNTAPSRALDVTGSVGADSVIVTNASFTRAVVDTILPYAIKTRIASGILLCNTAGARIGMISDGGSLSMEDSVVAAAALIDTTRTEAIKMVSSNGFRVTDSSGESIALFADSGAFTYLESVAYATTNATLAATASGTTYVARPLGSKKSLTLPAAAAGIHYSIMVADADSLRIIAASGDSLITSAGVAARSISSVAGTVKLIAVDTVRWIMIFTLGTWTPDNGVL